VIPYSFTEEKINVLNALRFSLLPEAQVLKVGDHTYSQIINTFIQRARNINEATGEAFIWTAWWEPEKVCNLQTRRYSGIRGAVPEWLPKEEKCAPTGFQCLSPFALPKLLRQALRCGTDLDDCDLCLSHIQMQLRRLDGKFETPVTQAYFNNKDELIQYVLTTPWGKCHNSEAAVKELLTSIMYENNFVPDDAGDFVKDFAAEQARIRAFDAEQHPQLLEHMINKKHPLASLECYLNMDEERKCLDITQDIAWKTGKSKPNSFEHDGMVGAKWSSFIKKFEAAGLKLKVKPIPRTFDNLLDLAKAYSTHDHVFLHISMKV
jgi:hypothetical protein